MDNLIVKKSLKSLGLAYNVELEDNDQIIANNDESKWKIDNLIKKCRRLVGLLNHSTTLNDDLKEDQMKNHITEKPLRLIQESIYQENKKNSNKGFRILALESWDYIRFFLLFNG